MARYIQRISLLGKEKWIGWEVDGVGTEIPGLMLADGLSEDELRQRGIKDFHTLSFESFIGMGRAVASSREPLDEEIDFRLDALQVGLDRLRSRGASEVPAEMLAALLGPDLPVEHPRVQQRIAAWQRSGAVELEGRPECYLRLTGRLA